MAHFVSGEDERRRLGGFCLFLDTDSLSDNPGLFGGGVMAASPSGNVGGVGGHSTADILN